MAGLTTKVMARTGKNKPITFKTLERIYKSLECTLLLMIMERKEMNRIELKDKSAIRNL